MSAVGMERREWIQENLREKSQSHSFVRMPKRHMVFILIKRSLCADLG